MAAFIPVLLALGLGYALFGSDKQRRGAAGDSQYRKADIDAVTIWRDIPGAMARYFRQTFIASVGIQLQYFKAQLISQSGTTLVYKLIRGGYGGNAGNVAWVARQSNQVVYAPVGLALGTREPDLYMMISAQAQKATFPYQGSGYAILYDISNDQYSGEQPGANPGANPGVGPGTIPGVDPRYNWPGEMPPIAPPGTGVPTQQPPIPNIPPVPGVPPPPYGNPPPGTTPPTDPVCDANMSAQECALLKQFLADPTATCDSVKLARDAAKYKGYVKAVDALNAKMAKVCPPIEGGPPVPGVPPVPGIPPVPGVPPVPGIPPVPGVPPQQTGNKPHVIREGDIPYIMAKYYTGNGARYRDLLPVNPGMKEVTKNGVTQLQPWNVGDTIQLPAVWNPWSKPPPGTAKVPTPPTTPPFSPPVGNPPSNNLPPDVLPEID